MSTHRPNVALVLRRADGRILLAERADTEGAWQFPQGGVDAGETMEEALEREMREELCLEPVDYRVVARSGPHRYDFVPPRLKEGYSGQEQTYFLADFLGREETIMADPSTVEFRSLRWVEPADVPLSAVAAMKRPVYRAVLRDFFGVTLPEPDAAG